MENERQLEDDRAKVDEHLAKSLNDMEEMEAIIDKLVDDLRQQSENKIRWVDSKGREFYFNFTIGQLLKLKREFGIDLLAPQVFGPSNTVELFAAIEVILEKQIQRHAIDIDELADELAKDIPGVFESFNERLSVFYLAQRDHKAEAILLGVQLDLAASQMS